MKNKRLVMEFPFALKVYMLLSKIIYGPSNRRTIAELEQVPYSLAPRMVDAVKSLDCKLPKADADWIDRIEAERKRVRERPGLLVDVNRPGFSGASVI